MFCNIWFVTYCVGEGLAPLLNETLVSSLWVSSGDAINDRVVQLQWKVRGSIYELATVETKPVRKYLQLSIWLRYQLDSCNNMFVICLGWRTANLLTRGYIWWCSLSAEFNDYCALNASHVCQEMIWTTSKCLYTSMMDFVSTSVITFSRSGASPLSRWKESMMSLVTTYKYPVATSRGSSTNTDSQLKKSWTVAPAKALDS